MVTDHGASPSLASFPEAVSLRERVEALRKAGAIAWSGRRLRPAKPAGKVRGSKLSPIWSLKTRVIAYLDASALVKHYIVERGSRETIALTADSEMTARAWSRTTSRGAPKVRWRLAGSRSCTSHGSPGGASRGAGVGARLRGYDAVQLASALTWRESVGEEIVVVTFDQQLCEAARRTGLKIWPEKFPGGTGGSKRRQHEQEGAP